MQFIGVGAGTKTVMAQVAAEVASPQLRNQGTIGGNLCHKTRCWYYRGEFHCLRKGGEKCFALGGENQFHAILGHEYICAMTHPSDTAPVLVAGAAAAAVANAVPLSKNSYKTAIFQGLLEEELAKAAEKIPS